MKFVGPPVDERAQLRKRARTRSPPQRRAAARPASRPASQARRRERTPAPRSNASAYVETHAKRWGPVVELKARRLRYDVEITDPALEDENTLAAFAIEDLRPGDLIFNLVSQEGEFFGILDMTVPDHFAGGRMDFDARSADADQASRLLNKILRHQLMEWGLYSDSGAWTPLRAAAHAVGLSSEELVELVARDPEGRYLPLLSSRKGPRCRLTSPTSGPISRSRCSTCSRSG